MGYKVYAEHYYDDRRRTDEVFCFGNLEEDFTDWVDRHSNGSLGAFLPWWTSRVDGAERIQRISVSSSDGGDWWVHEIDGPLGIEFTDGSRTQGKKHISRRVRSVLQSYYDEKTNPEARFVD